MKRANLGSKSLSWRFVLAALAFLPVATPSGNSLELKPASWQVRNLELDQGERLLHLPKKKTTHHVSFSGGWSGCMGYTTAKLKEMWAASGNSGKMPPCSYWYHDDDDSSGGGSSSGGSSGGGSSSGGSSGGGSSGGGSSGGGGDSYSGGDGDGNGDGNGEQQDGGEGEVTNDDVSNDGNGDNDGNNDGGGNGNNNGGDGNDQQEDNGNGNDGNDGNNNGDNDGNNGGDNRYSDPYQDFDIARCDTYENLWAWDIELLCSDDNDPSACTCQYASKLIALGTLSCQNIIDCPNGCAVCTNCLRVLGCDIALADEEDDPRSIAKLNTSSIVLLVAGAAILIFGLLYFLSRRRNRPHEELTTQLLEDVDRPAGFIPLAGRDSASSSEADQSADSVWLAPEGQASYAEQFDPSARAAALATAGGDYGSADDSQMWLAPVNSRIT